ncbi:hypothetical protein B296_00055423 [Ensete ventricosum]|uniref:Gnk2-homologous domain-containing protein n=1 Tax=Ensete ventricosum TaxID=4639 RepID=A0A426X7Z0_ENSVE|nr:hypothetical protein B296_00055423 [Ensete ventricosum]
MSSPAIPPSLPSILLSAVKLRPSSAQRSTLLPSFPKRPTNTTRRMGNRYHMKEIHELFLLLFLLFFLRCSVAVASSDDFTAFVYVGCSQTKSVSGSPYQSNVDSLLTSLANAAALSSYDSFTSSAASTTNPAYGLFQCRTDLANSVCASCVRSALDQLSSLCPSSTGATVQLKGCFFRYGDESFLGKPDTTLLYNKCGSVAPDEHSSDLLVMRDTALSGLASGGGNYRLGTGGRVRGLAQCVGDQSPNDCGGCVAAAVAQLKDICGVADAGDAYLGKCYVSYWSDAVDTSGHHHGNRPSGGRRWTVIVFLCLLSVAALGRV